ncbi:MAG: aminoglycoside phosphotransferase family protein [Clostridia bacterium]|nr:aminoglycoside phosphotransferase family protein [Clostridia bacterium]
MAIDLNDILNEFNLESEIDRYGNGHINDTYLTNSRKYILQRINTNVFKNPEKLMDNIEKVTDFLREKIIAEGGNPKRETMKVIRTRYNKNHYRIDDNNVFRVYEYVNNTISIETSKSYTDLYNAGKGFGHFQKLLSDFPAEQLYETIPNFHNTPSRVDNLVKAINEDKMGRAKDIQQEIDFALEFSKEASVVTDAIAKGDILLRVTHNDTKINNILFDEKTREAVCVIDLDTVMPGSILYDFGDALRMGGSTGAEDETDLSKVNFDAKAFEAFAKGFCSETMHSMTEMEKELLPFSVKLMTYECGIRFLTDYLEGDTYFKIHRPGHNLDRARNQFKIVADIHKQQDDLLKIIKQL